MFEHDEALCVFSLKTRLIMLLLPKAVFILTCPDFMRMGKNFESTQVVN